MKRMFTLILFFVLLSSFVSASIGSIPPGTHCYFDTVVDEVKLENYSGNNDPNNKCEVTVDPDACRSCVNQAQEDAQKAQNIENFISLSMLGIGFLLLIYLVTELIHYIIKRKLLLNIWAIIFSVLILFGLVFFLIPSLFRF